MPPKITIELYPPNGGLWRYDATKDGPLNEWLLSVVPSLGPEYSNMSHNASIRVWPK